MSLTKTEPRAIVNLQNCVELAGTDKPFIFVLNIGENLFESLVKCASLMKLKSAAISGLGTLTQVTVAYYHLHKKEYQTKLFSEAYEVVSLQGNISSLEGKPFVHIHAALGQEDYSIIGGHIMDAVVDACMEMTVIPLAAPINRAYDDETGLKLMCPLLK